MGLSSSLIIAFCRVVLASFFLLAIYLDPSQPASMPEYGYAILGLYVVAAIVFLTVAWASWWLDFCLAKPAHVLDLVTFGAVVFFTEGYTSPFFTFSVFLMLSASIRWSTRETAFTALAVNVLFLGAGTIAQLTIMSDIDLQRVIIRSTYLLVLAALFILYAANSERLRRTPRAPAGAGISNTDVRFADAALRLVRERTSAEGVIIAWRDADEPRGWITCLDNGGIRDRMLPAAGINWALDIEPGMPAIFRRAGNHMVQGATAVRSGALTPAMGRGLAAEEITEGLALPVKAGGIEATIFAAGVGNLSTDHLGIGARLLDELGELAEDMAYGRIAADATESRVRMMVARDLHDSVAQFLAGVSFRLEALKQSGRSAHEMRGDITGFQDELASEQDHLRELIADLRGEPNSPGLVDPGVRMPKLLDRQGRQWGIATNFACTPGLRLPAAIEVELHQMVREGIANAVRHGGAGQVYIALSRTEGELQLRIADDGTGLSTGPSGGAKRPSSLSERMASLGGRIEFTDGENGATVVLSLPLEYSP